ncbi:hypothetical protein L211DRAFT_810690 [Terfezia boudieri ATCC MYA-4762]|uniref:TFIIS N-terminal domain-containing protein n=1 Tax=Terfezia boudieri ATCC MYA-4762 TaxID=1051890 RepID=A0A3N4LI42_9PEZI|nr:hypothetical protein L211DRAFT_810690 [Terfezia boudieri ATCC MYA-4762]
MDITDGLEHLGPSASEEKPKLTADALAVLDERKADAEADDASDSDLSEIDDNLFKDYQQAIPLNNRPVVPIDEDAVARLGVHRRQRDPNEVTHDRPIIKKGGKRRRREEDGEEELGGVGRRTGGGGGGGRKGGRAVRAEGERPERPARILTAEEQRIADLDAKIGEALKSKTKRRKKKDEVELEQFQDDLIANLRDRMIAAAERDYADVKSGHAATHKIRMLEEVRSVITKPNLVVSCMDNNFLSAVRRWLEPLDNNALPAYSIQKDLFKYLTSINPDVENLRESGIGKIVSFYTKDVRPQPDIKRQANTLMRDWTRPILGRSDDYKTKLWQEAKYDPSQVFSQSASQRAPREDEDRDPLALPARNPNRTRVPMSMPKTYEIVPKSTVTPGGVKMFGSQADELVKRVKARQMAMKKGGKKSGLSIEGRGLY